MTLDEIAGFHQHEERTAEAKAGLEADLMARASWVRKARWHRQARERLVTTAHLLAGLAEKGGVST